MIAASATAAARPESEDLAARVRLGANGDTPASLLLELAADRAVTVRAAVAMNPAAPHQADRLLAGDDDERVRRLLARKLALLLPEIPPTGRDPPQEQALAILGEMIDDAAERVRAAIAEAVKEMPQVPRGLILRLAHDSAMAVCGPVIRMSPLLTPEDLLTLLAAPPSPATATAIAHRPGLTEGLCDGIAAGADTAAITALLGNATAAIREQTLDGLIARAAAQPDWHAPLVRRPRLSAQAIRSLSAMVVSQLLEELSLRRDVDPELGAELRQRLDAQQAAPRGRTPPTRPEPSMEEAMGEARHLCAEDRLDEAAMLGALQRGEVRMATALLAVAAEVPGSVVDRAATLRSAKGLVSLIWKAGFSMRVAVPLQSLLARIAPAALLRPGPGDGFPLAVEEMRWQIDFLSKMGR